MDPLFEGLEPYPHPWWYDEMSMGFAVASITQDVPDEVRVWVASLGEKTALYVAGYRMDDDAAFVRGVYQVYSRVPSEDLAWALLSHPCDADTVAWLLGPVGEARVSPLTALWLSSRRNMTRDQRRQVRAMIEPVLTRLRPRSTRQARQLLTHIAPLRPVSVPTQQHTPEQLLEQQTSWVSLGSHAGYALREPQKPTPLVSAFGAALGPDPATWQLAFSMMREWPGTLGQLAACARMLPASGLG